MSGIGSVTSQKPQMKKLSSASSSSQPQANQQAKGLKSQTNQPSMFS